MNFDFNNLLILHTLYQMNKPKVNCPPPSSKPMTEEEQITTDYTDVGYYDEDGNFIPY